MGQVLADNIKILSNLEWSDFLGEAMKGAVTCIKTDINIVINIFQRQKA